MHVNQQPIAIVGMECRLPGARNVEEYWDLLIRGVDAITEVPPERWSVSDFYDENPGVPAKMCTKWGGFIAGVDLFDAAFFGIAPREAIQMEPQQRILLEMTWHALERAGIPPASLAGSPTGVFVGISSFDYYELIQEYAEQICGYTLTGNAYSITANRLSYVFDLCGPSMAIDTACSSSLVAVHQACQSLRSGESELAIAAGVHVMVSPWVSVAASKGGMMALDGRCKTFDARADGYVRSEGAGVLILKRLDDALAAGDPICAVIRGSAVNQDGRSNGLTAPNPKRQKAVIQEACRNAGVQPARIGYLEAHGTGTRLGDPIEIEALAAVLGEGRAAGSRCWVASAKTNIGHTEAAAGVASVIKAALVVRHGQVPKHLHFEQPNPLIDFAHLPIDIPLQTVSWNAEGGRVAGVNSFGFGGTNAHLILEQPPPSEPDTAAAGPHPHLLLLSAKSPAALEQLADEYSVAAADLLSEASLAQICRTSVLGRDHFQHRLAVMVESPEKMIDALKAVARAEPHAEAISGTVSRRDSPRLGFLFTGQGSQYPSMGRELYEISAVFRQTLQRCDEILRPLLSVGLIESLYESPHSAELLTATAFAQPALFSIEVALSDMLRSWNIRPAAVLGHSLGEFSACYAAGVFTLEAGLNLVAHRGRLMQSSGSAGAMAAVFASESAVHSLLESFAELQIAALNASEHIVITGPEASVAGAVTAARASGIEAQMLPVRHAFHSRSMEPAAAEFAAIVSATRFATASIPVISNVTGQPVGPQIGTAEYWCRHLLEPVRFADGLQALAAEKLTALVEVGPKPVLSSMARRALPAQSCFSTLRAAGDDWRQLLRLVAELHCRGSDVAWPEVFSHGKARRCRLPTYPFQGRRFWITDEPPSGASVLSYHSARSSLHPMMANARRVGTEADNCSLRLGINLGQFPYLGDHRVRGTAIFPATAYIELVQAAATEFFHHTGWQIQDMEFHAPLVLGAETRPLNLEFHRLDTDRVEFQFGDVSRAGRNDAVVYATGVACRCAS